MPGVIKPSRSDVHVNRPLTNIAVAMVQSAANFVAGRVFPGVGVDKQSDLYFVMPRDDWNRDDFSTAIRAPGTESRGVNMSVSTDSYSALVRSLHQDVADQVRSNQDDPLDLDRQATQLLVGKYLIGKEIKWASTYFAGGVWSWEFDGVSSGATAVASLDPTDNSNNNVLQWNDGSSTPIEDIRYAKRYMLSKTGFMPNKLTVGRAVFDYLVDHPDIVGRLDRGQTSGVAKVTRDSLAALFEVDEVLVMDAIKNTAKEGATATHAFIGGKHALLSYAPAAPGIMIPSAGYTFNWTGYMGATNDGYRMKKFRMDVLESDRIEIDAAFDLKKVSGELGFFFDGIVA